VESLEFALRSLQSTVEALLLREGHVDRCLERLRDRINDLVGETLTRARAAYEKKVLEEADEILQKRPGTMRILPDKEG
jgi:hypothetical protein